MKRTTLCRIAATSIGIFLDSLDGVPINSYIQVFDEAVKPAGGPVWSLRLQVQVLLPK